MEYFDYDTYTTINKFCTKINATEMSDVDLERTQYIREEIDDCCCNNKIKSKFIKKDSLISDALMNLGNIGFVTTLERAAQILRTILFVENQAFKTYHFEVLASFTTTETGAYKTAYCILHPKKVDLTSKIFLCHEIAHILKERNDKEVINCYTTEESIPIATELISAVQSENDNISRDIMRNRLNMLKNTLSFYKSVEAELLIEDDEIKRTALTTALKKANCYFNSFYYALILFELYLSNPDRIINLINYVLEGNLTTDDMLGLLNQKKYDEWADNGLQEFKKMLY